MRGTEALSPSGLHGGMKRIGGPARSVCSDAYRLNRSERQATPDPATPSKPNMGSTSEGGPISSLRTVPRLRSHGSPTATTRGTLRVMGSSLPAPFQDLLMQ